MKSHRGIVWYFFLIYSTCVLVNFAGDREQPLRKAAGLTEPSSLLGCALRADGGSKRWTKQCRPAMAEMRSSLVRLVQTLAQSETLASSVRYLEQSLRVEQSKRRARKERRPSLVEKLVRAIVGVFFVKPLMR